MLLNIHARAKSVHVSDDTKAYLEKKLAKFGKLFHGEPEVHVVQGFERGLHIAEITLHGDGVLLRSQERHGDLRCAIDHAIAKLETQIKRYKGKRSDNHRHVSAIKAEAEAALEAEDEFAARIVRRKRFPMESLSPEEAARRMELVGHSFFIFENEETRRISVLYRREDGDYGLIDPQ